MIFISIARDVDLDIRIFVRKGVSEVLMLLGEAWRNSALGEELRGKTKIARRGLGILMDEGVLDKTEERVLVKNVPIKRRIATYNISDKGKRLLEICETLSTDEAEEFLRISPQQLNVLRIFLKEGPKRSRDLPETLSDFLMRLVNRGFLDKDVKEVEEKQEVYRLKRTYTLTDKGRKIYEALQTIKSL